MTKIKAIQTEYNGYLFRSRLEARWAVVFDAMGIEYEYEPEGFDLGDGIHYLPDFLLHGIKGRHRKGPEPGNVYVEVKGASCDKDISDEDKEKINRFTGLHEYNLIIKNSNLNDDEDSAVWKKITDDYPSLYVVGNIPKPSSNWGLEINCYGSMISTGLDNRYLFSCEPIDSDPFGLALCIGEDGEPWLIDANMNQAIPDDHKTDMAYEKARKARFEHGETPKVIKIGGAANGTS